MKFSKVIAKACINACAQWLSHLPRPTVCSPYRHAKSSFLRRFFFCLGLLGLVTVTVDHLGWAQSPREWIVPWDCQSLQDCIRKARPGDRISIRPGIYTENVQINKRDLTLQGTDPQQVTLQAKNPSLPALFLTNDAKGTLLQGFTVRGGKHGLQLDRTRQVRVNKLIITESNGHGLVLQDVYQFEMRDSEISHHRASGLSVSMKSDHISFDNVMIRSNDRHGFEMSDAKAELRRSVLRDNADCGIFLAAGSVLDGRENAALRNGRSAVCAPGGRTVSETFWEQTPPAPPAQMRLSPPNWTNQFMSVDWHTPSERSEIVAFWFKIGSPPSHPEDGLRLAIDRKPLLLQDPPEGRNTLYVWLEDNRGKKDHMQRGQTVYFYDATPPRLSIEFASQPNSAGWYNTSVTATFVGEDDLSGISHCSPTLIENAEGWNIPIQGECVDRAGNRQSQVEFINVDRTPPSGALLINEGARATLKSEVVLHLQVSDELSRITQMRFSNDRKNWSPWEAYKPIQSWSLALFGGTTRWGKKTVYAQLQDGANNETILNASIDYTASIQPLIEDAAPNSVIALPPGVFPNNCLKISKSVTLRGAGLDRTTLRGSRCSAIEIESGDDPIQVNIEGITVTEARGMPLSTALIKATGKIKLSITDVRITGSEGYGLGLFFEESTESSLTLVNSEISDNSATGIAGYNAFSVSITSSQILRNGGRGIDLSARFMVLEKSEITQNEGAGIFLSSGIIRIANSKISENAGGGLLSWGQAWYQLTLTDSQFRDNLIAGVTLANIARAKIWNTQIVSNKGYGIALLQRPCFDTLDTFKGLLEGSGNVIEKNIQTDLCPEREQYTWPSGFTTKP